MGITFNPWKIAEKMQSNEELAGIGGYEQKMMEQYMMQKPGEDFTGIPGLEQLQRKFQEKQRQQAVYQPQGMAQEFAKGKSKEDKKKKKEMFNPMEMTRQGPQYMTGNRRKDQIFQKIQEKREMGAPISNLEANWERKYLGISDAKTVPDTPTDRVRVRKVAKDMAQAAFIDQGVEATPGEEHIQAQMSEATKFLYPKADQEAIEQKDYSITLPENITKQSQAVEYLIKQGMDEEEAKSFLKEGL